MPPLAAVALGWLVHGARPRLALLVVPLFALAWAAKGDSAAQRRPWRSRRSPASPSAGSWSASFPPRWLKLGIYAMAAIDAYLVVTDLLQDPNAVLNAAAPAADLPRLQLAHLGSALMGFGDLFIAAVLGALLACDRRLQLRGAAVAAVICLACDLLFFFVDETPATVPIALTLACLELTGALALDHEGDQTGNEG